MRDLVSVAVLMPVGITDEWRDRARVYVSDWYAKHFPDAELVVGECAGEWSKGEAIANAAERAGSGAQAFVLADADSFTRSPEELRAALDRVAAGAPWATPHTHVYRLRDTETRRIEDDPRLPPRLGYTARPVYVGPVGGGITVVSREAFDTVRGIDRRFLGWGGEDHAFGWALETLTGPGARIGGRLVHLWHPHPAPDLRPPAESQQLLELYRSARGMPRRMAAVVAGEQWEPAPELPEPIRFTMTANRRLLRLASGEVIRFTNGRYETRDPDVIGALRTVAVLREDRRR